MTDPSPTRRLPDVEAAPRGLRWLFASLGCCFLAVGAVGVLLPLLPTTPFVLLAAGCFARGSTRLHAWLLNTRLFGPTLRAWYETRSIPFGAKITAIMLIGVMLGATLVFVPLPPAAQITLVIIGVGVVIALARIPTRVTPAAHDAATVLESAPTSE